MRFVKIIINSENASRLIISDRSSYNKTSFPLTIDETVMQTGNRIAAVRKILLMYTCFKLLHDSRINIDNTNDIMENNNRWSALMLIKLLSKERGINRMSANVTKYVFLCTFN